jgi:hypothetical protein
MENKINVKLEKHQLLFKQSIKEWIQTHNATIKCADEDTSASVSTSASTSASDKTSEFIQFIFDYNNMSIKKEDLQKRTRTKNAVPHCDLCIAKIANGIQCTRRKQSNDVQFCGTHIKGQPYGIESKVDTAVQQTKKVEIWVQEIKGINYYIDDTNNVYKPEDIISNTANPAVIAKWALNEAGTYVIPAFGI